MRILIEGWEDGQAVRGHLDAPCREQTQAADLLTVELPGGQSVSIKQNPAALKGSNIRVGACVWDGALVMAAYLASWPCGSFQGMRCVELGAGVGLVGLVLAKLGATVTLTDMPSMTIFAKRNIAKNYLASSSVSLATKAPPAHQQQHDDKQQNGSQKQQDGQGQQQQQQQQQQAPIQPGSADVVALEWGAPGYMETVASLAQQPISLVVATDCLYIDPNGSIPSSTHFMAAAAGLCNLSTRVLVTFEARSDELRQALLSDARGHFSRVAQVPQQQLPEQYRLQHIEMYELGL